MSGLDDEKYLDISRMMTKSIKNSQTCFLKEAGHSVHLEQEHEFALAIKSFLTAK